MNCEKCGSENLLVYQDGEVIDCLDCYHRRGEKTEKRKPGTEFKGGIGDRRHTSLYTHKTVYCKKCKLVFDEEDLTHGLCPFCIQTIKILEDDCEIE